MLRIVTTDGAVVKFDNSCSFTVESLNANDVLVVADSKPVALYNMKSVMKAEYVKDDAEAKEEE